MPEPSDLRGPGAEGGRCPSREEHPGPRCPHPTCALPLGPAAALPRRGPRGGAWSWCKGKRQSRTLAGPASAPGRQETVPRGQRGPGRPQQAGQICSILTVGRGGRRPGAGGAPAQVRGGGSLWWRGGGGGAKARHRRSRIRFKGVAGILGFRLRPWPAARQVLGLGSWESGLEGAPGYTKLLGRGGRGLLPSWGPAQRCPSVVDVHVLHTCPAGEEDRDRVHGSGPRSRRWPHQWPHGAAGSGAGRQAETCVCGHTGGRWEPGCEAGQQRPVGLSREGGPRAGEPLRPVAVRQPPAGLSSRARQVGCAPGQDPPWVADSCLGTSTSVHKDPKRPARQGQAGREGGP